jgi:hypothetical protein
MDTGNTGTEDDFDVLISSQVVADLRFSSMINRQAPIKRKTTANGVLMESEGTVQLAWKSAAGQNTRQDTFYVFPHLNEDVNFGRNFLIELRIFPGFNVGALSTLKGASAEKPRRSFAHPDVKVHVAHTNSMH